MILASSAPPSLQPSLCLQREVNRALAIPEIWQFNLGTDADGLLNQGDFVGKLFLGQVIYSSKDFVMIIRLELVP